MKNILKIIFSVILAGVLLYIFIFALTYYQYNFSPDFADKKPVEINNNP